MRQFIWFKPSSFIHRTKEQIEVEINNPFFDPRGAEVYEIVPVAYKRARKEII